MTIFVVTIAILLAFCVNNLADIAAALKQSNKLHALQLKKMGVAEEELEKIMNKK